jgi:hypothetical protein
MGGTIVKSMLVLSRLPGLLNFKSILHEHHSILALETRAIKIYGIIVEEVR